MRLRTPKNHRAAVFRPAGVLVCDFSLPTDFSDCSRRFPVPSGESFERSADAILLLFVYIEPQQLHTAFRRGVIVSLLIIYIKPQRAVHPLFPAPD